MPNQRTVLEGSVRSVFQHLEPSGKPDPQESLAFSLILRSAPAAGSLPSAEELSERCLRGEIMSQKDLEERFGADSEDLAQVESFANEHSLKIDRVEQNLRTVRLSGSIADINAAFGIDLSYFKHASGTCLGHLKEISLPANLKDIVQGVRGLDTYPIGQRQAAPKGSCREKAGEQPPNLMLYTPPEVADLYSFPKGLDGTGQTIGLMVLGGGYDLDVLKSYFDYLNLPMPEIVDVSAGGQNNYQPGELDTQEVMLDIEMAGSIAPGAKIVVYFGTTYGYVETLAAAVSDDVNKPDVLSLSFSSPEVIFTAQELALYNQYVIEALAKGITIFASSGDTGSSVSAFRPELGFINNLAITNFPPSNWGVLGCGGTYLCAKGDHILSEVVWNFLGWLFKAVSAARTPPVNWGSSGGGESIVTDRPFYQAKAEIDSATNDRTVFQPKLVQESLGSAVPIPPKGRGVPDVSGNAVGYKVLFAGRAPEDLVFSGGTSAVSPLWAALIARINQGLGRRVGFLHPILYERLRPGAIRPIENGCNGAYQARPGMSWDACTGLGVPDGTVLYEQLKVILGSN